MVTTPPRTYDWDSVLAYSSAAMNLTEQDVEELRSERSIKSTKVCSFHSPEFALFAV